MAEENTTALIPSSLQDLERSMVDIAGQLLPSSRRIYMNDARYFAQWMLAQGLQPQDMTRSHMLAYRSHLADSAYSKPTKQRMFSVASKLMKEQFISGNIPTLVTQEVKGFKVDGDETTHTALSKSQARDMLETVQT